MIKSIDLNQKEFTANGRKYIILDKITPERYKEYEKLVPELTFGLGFAQIYANLQKIWEYLNKMEFGNASVVCHNTMKGIKNIDDSKRIHPALMMAALVIVREDEDCKVYDKQLMLEKINDWQSEGLDMLSFFALSLNSIQGFREALIDYTNKNLNEIGLEMEKK